MKPLSEEKLTLIRVQAVLEEEQKACAEAVELQEEELKDIHTNYEALSLRQGETLTNLLKEYDGLQIRQQELDSHRRSLGRIQACLKP